MKKFMRCGFVLVPIVLLGMILINITGMHFGGNTGVPFQQGGQFGHHGGGHHFGREGRPFGMIYGQASFFIPVFFLMLVKAGLALAGWVIWKNSKAKGGQLAGAVLFSLAVFALLPKILGIPLLLLMAYFGYKAYQQTNETNLEYFPANELTAGYQIENQIKTRDFLDEWEKSIRREEK